MKQRKDEIKKNNRAGNLYCILGAMCWGFSGTCGEAIFRNYEIAPAWLTSVRMVAAGIILLIIMAIGGRVKISDVIKDRKGLLQIAAFALFGLLFCQITYLSAIKYTNSGTATVLQNLSIIFVTLYVCIRTKKLPDIKQVCCILLAMVGVWLLATGGQPGNLQMTPLGLLWGIGAGLGATSYALLSKAPIQKWGSVPVTGIGMLSGGVVLCIIMKSWEVPEGLDLRLLLLFSLIVLVGTVGAFTLFLKGISIVGPVKGTILGCMEPLTAGVLSALWLHSYFSVTDLIGFACIIATVFILRK